MISYRMLVKNLSGRSRSPASINNSRSASQKRALSARILGRLYIRQAHVGGHRAASIAASTRSGVNGICVTLTPTASSFESRLPQRGVSSLAT